MNNDQPTNQSITLVADDAVELAELLEFFCDWFDRDRTRLDKSLWALTAGCYTIAHLRDDCRRFVDQLETSPTKTGPIQ